MAAQTPPPAADSHDKEAASADAAQSQPDPIAISPALGPLAVIYVPRAPGESEPIGLLWHLTARAVRLAGRWAARHLPHRHPATQDGELSPARPNSSTRPLRPRVDVRGRDRPLHGQPAARKPDDAHVYRDRGV